ncbi:hypothetical protein FD723_35815 (plasmid) [Nostoc sp. C052]|uniref:hypothetical protein n=1 Tax=Nostoc sp. C052 TaxID=2576902 RepID=UPI0015C2E0DE|nr:hypothetical protein [Nostoc sp. C052]QLE45630.1 hypothetical protein FD723_35815 [Nostoc sp. C052]
MQEVEFCKSELIQYYWQRLKLINDPYIKCNPNAKKYFPEVVSDQLKWESFDIAVELHRNNSKPWIS